MRSGRHRCVPFTRAALSRCRSYNSDSGRTRCPGVIFAVGGGKMDSSVETLVNREYAYGFVSPIESEAFLPGLSEDVVRAISAKKEEPEWLLEWRLKAYRKWLTLTEPH